MQSCFTECFGKNLGFLVRFTQHNSCLRWRLWFECRIHHASASRPLGLECVKATALGDWVVQSVEGTIARHGMAKWQGVLDTEWGGMNEAFFNLSVHTASKACTLLPVPVQCVARVCFLACGSRLVCVV